MQWWIVPTWTPPVSLLSTVKSIFRHNIGRRLSWVSNSSFVPCDYQFCIFLLFIGGGVFFMVVNVFEIIDGGWHVNKRDVFTESLAPFVWCCSSGPNLCCTSNSIFGLCTNNYTCVYTCASTAPYTDALPPCTLEICSGDVMLCLAGTTYMYVHVLAKGISAFRILLSAYSCNLALFKCPFCDIV